MRNLFTANYFKNQANEEKTQNVDVAKQWLKEGIKVVCRLRDLSSYFELDLNVVVEDIIQQDGVIYIKVVGYLFPFIGFFYQVHILRIWEILECNDSSESGETTHTRDLSLAKTFFAQGKTLICAFSEGYTSKIVSFENMGGVDYIITESGDVYILEPEGYINYFSQKGNLKWPSEIG